MPIPKAILNKAQAKKPKTGNYHKQKLDSAIIEQFCSSQELGDTTFRSYFLVDLEGKQQELCDTDVKANLRSGIILIKAKSVADHDIEYDLSSITKTGIERSKMSKECVYALTKLRKRFDLEVVSNIRYFDLKLDSSSMVIDSPYVFRFLDYHLIIGRLETKKAIGKRLDPSFGSEQALAEQVEALQNIEND